ncbi:MAG: glycosyltransferase [bacterium]|nr:glycosyltransferase [bacterium]
MINKIKNKIHQDGIKSSINWILCGVRHRIKHLIGKIKKDNSLGNRKLRKRKGIHKKNTNKIYIFACVPYFDIGGGQRSSQLAKTFNRLGYRVYYYYANFTSESKIYNLSIPTVEHRPVKKIKPKKFATDITKDDLCIVEMPSPKFIPFIKIAHQKGSSIVYENIDNWETSLGKKFFSKDILKEILQKCNFVTTTAQPLTLQTQKYFRKFKIKNKQILYSPNAVNDELFDKNKEYDLPVDMIKGKKNFIYYGSLWGEWFDWNLVVAIAQSDSNCIINLIGDSTGIVERKKSLPPNIRFLGLKKQDELPAYLYHSDIALLPFKVDEIGKFVSPLKVFEYIAMNKIVISSYLPDIVNYPNIYFGNTELEWAKLSTEQLLSDVSLCDSFVNKNNWYTRCIDILETVYKNKIEDVTKKYKQRISIIVKCKSIENNMLCIERLLEYRERYGYNLFIKCEISTVKTTKIENDRYEFLNEENFHHLREYVLILNETQIPLHKYWLDNYLKIFDNFEVDCIGNDGTFSNELVPVEYYDEKIDDLNNEGLFCKTKYIKRLSEFNENISILIRQQNGKIAFSPYLGVKNKP